MKYPVLVAVVFLCGLLGSTDSQGSTPSIDEVRDKIASVVDIPELSNMNTSAVLPAIEEAKNLFKQKCDKNGGPEAYDNAKAAREELEDCLKNLINIPELQAEMEKYKPTGDLDIVFKNHCRKSPIFKGCVHNFTTAIEPCLEERERENKRIIQNITDSLLSFVCFKEGDRIALFISAGGPECFQSKQQEVQNCVNSTFGSYIPTADPNTGALPGLESLPKLILDTKECTDITKLQACVVKELEKCPDPTPANIVDSIFNFILRVTPCEKLLQNQARTFKSTSSGVSLIGALTTTSIAVLLLKLL